VKELQSLKVRNTPVIESNGNADVIGVMLRNAGAEADGDAGNKAV
jgi:hypothetical protein